MNQIKHNIDINVNRVCFCYEKEQPTLSDISFHAGGNEAIGLIGANGAGKSTLLKLLVGLYLDFEGSIRIAGIPVQKDTLPEIRSKTGYVFQDSDSQLFMNTVYEEIAFAPRNYGLPETEVRRRAEQALRLTGAEHLRQKQIHKMSGGEKKLISIAVILAMTPDILFMDEPSITLDPRNRRNLIRLLNTFPQLKIIASHDLDLILDTCERTILMADGKLIRDGLTKEILTDQKLLEDNGLELPLCLSKRP